MKFYAAARIRTRHRRSAAQLAKAKPMDPILVALIKSAPAVSMPVGLTQETILRYAEEHLSHFTAMRKRYEEGETEYIRIGEVEHYINIWVEVIIANGEWDKLDKLAKEEVFSAHNQERNAAG